MLSPRHERCRRRPLARLDQGQEPETPRAGQGEGIFLMRKGPDGRGRETTVARLLARKQQILERPQENLSPEERDEIERQLAQIDTALNLLDEAGPGKTNDE